MYWYLHGRIVLANSFISKRKMLIFCKSKVFCLNCVGYNFFHRQHSKKEIKCRQLVIEVQGWTESRACGQPSFFHQGQLRPVICHVAGCLLRVHLMCLISVVMERLSPHQAYKPNKGGKDELQCFHTIKANQICWLVPFQPGLFDTAQIKTGDGISFAFFPPLQSPWVHCVSQLMQSKVNVYL